MDLEEYNTIMSFYGGHFNNGSIDIIRTLLHSNFTFQYNNNLIGPEDFLSEVDKLFFQPVIKNTIFINNVKISKDSDGYAVCEYDIEYNYNDNGVKCENIRVTDKFRLCNGQIIKCIRHDHKKIREYAIKLHKLKKNNFNPKYY